MFIDLPRPKKRLMELMYKTATWGFIYAEIVVQKLGPEKLLKEDCIVVEFCEIYQNSYFMEHLWTTTSGYSTVAYYNISSKIWKD